jgi:hypothetical protein
VQPSSAAQSTFEQGVNPKMELGTARGREESGPDAQTAGPPSYARWTLIAFAAILAAHIALAWLGRSAGIATGQDDVEYIVLSRSLQQGSYSELMRVDAPVHAQYPPGYPALLAVWSLVTGEGYDALVALSLLLSASTLGLLFLALRRRFSESVALCSAAVLAVNPHWTAAAGTIGSEIPYAFFATLALVLAARTRTERGPQLFAITTAIAAALTRSIGMTLLLGLGVHWLLERRWKTLLWFAAACALTIGPWMLWTTVAPEQRIGVSYIAEIRAIDGNTPWTLPLPQRIVEHARWYAMTGLPWSLALPTIPGTPVDNALALALLAVTGIAGAVVFVARWRPALFYAIAYAGLLLVWLWPAERFVIPLLPLVVPMILAGTFSILGRWNGRAGFAGIAAFALVLATSGAVQSLERVREQSRCRTGSVPSAECLEPDQVSYFEALRWIETNLPQDAVILTAKNGALYWYTGRRTISYGGSLAQDSASFLPWVRAQGAGWILLSSLEVAESNRLARLLSWNCEELEVDAFFPRRTYLFRIAGGPPAERPSEACVAMTAYREATAGGVPAAR